MVFLFGLLCFGCFIAAYMLRDTAALPYLALMGAVFALLAFLSVENKRRS